MDKISNSVPENIVEITSSVKEELRTNQSTGCLPRCSTSGVLQTRMNRYPIKNTCPSISHDSLYSNRDLEDDLESNSTSLVPCEHPYIARNGTTFSGMQMKYIVHSTKFVKQNGVDYLTPTQRAQQQIRKLRELLNIAKKNLEEKNSEIVGLTSELIQLRQFKASLHASELNLTDGAETESIDCKINQLAIGNCCHQQKQQMQISFTDSGHFEDLVSTSSAHVGEASANQTVLNAEDINESERKEIIRLYEKRIEDLIRKHDLTTDELKKCHNNKIEKLLQQLSSSNSRYADTINYESARERIRDLEYNLEKLQQKLIESEEKQKKMYLHMYQKQQNEQVISQIDQVLESTYKSNKLSVNELLQQLQATQCELENIRESEYRKESDSKIALLTAREAISLWVLGGWKTIYRRLLENRAGIDPEVKLELLKSAIYYFLTDNENSSHHLNMIKKFLDFSEEENIEIDKKNYKSEMKENK